MKLMTLFGKVGEARLPTAILLLTLTSLKQISSVGNMIPALQTLPMGQIRGYILILCVVTVCLCTLRLTSLKQISNFGSMMPACKHYKHKTLRVFVVYICNTLMYDDIDILEADLQCRQHDSIPASSTQFRG